MKPEYNIFSIAGSNLGFKHNEDFFKLVAYPVIVLNNLTGEIKEFISIRKAAIFVNIYHSYLAKCLNK